MTGHGTPASVIRFRVRRLSPGPFLGQGALAGALVALLPGAALGALILRLIAAAHHTLDAWRAVRLPLPAGLSPTVNFVELLRLDAYLVTLRAWDAVPTVTFLLVTLACILAGALAGAATALVLVTLVNLGAALGGGVVLELETQPEQ
jgi:hypothetical protein